MLPVLDAALVAAVGAIGTAIAGLATALTTIIQFLYTNLMGVKDIIKDGFSGTWQYLVSISASLSTIWQQLTPISKALITLLPLVSFLGGAIADPQGFANAFMCGFIDMIVGVLPSTPSQYQVGTLIQNIITDFPESAYLLSSTFQGIAGIFAIYLGVKAFRFLPFF